MSGSGWGDLRLVPAALAAWSVSLAVALAGPRTGACVTLAWAGAAMVGLALARRARIRGVAALLCLAALAGGAALLTATAADSRHAWQATRAAEGGVEVRAIVAQVRPTRASGGDRVSVHLDVEAWRQVSATGSAPDAPWREGAGRLVVVTDSDGAPVRGDTAVAHGSLSPATGGAVDALLDGEIVAVTRPSGWRAHVVAARAAFSRALARAPEATVGLVEGMVLGDTGRLDPSLADAMRETGLAHLTAVSGAHFAILAAGVGLVLRRLRAGPWLTAAGTLIAIGGFAIVVAGGGAVLRAVVMAVIAAGALVAGRRGQVVPGLATAVIVLVVVRPDLAEDLGLALSVAAVAAIGLLAPWLAHRLARVVVPALAEAAAVTIAAQAACMPLLALMDARLGPWAVAANALATPFAIPVTLLGVAGLALAIPAPDVAAVLVELAGWAAWPVAVTARAFAEAPGASLRWPAGVRGIVLGLCLIGAVAVAARATGRTARAATAVALAVTAIAFAPATWLPPGWGGAPRGWTVAACDVGQGDALVVRAAGAVLMVDAGPRGPAAALCLARLGVTRIDLLVLTHEHADHTGGLDEVADAAEIGAVWLPHAASPATTSGVARATTDTRLPVEGEAVTLGGIQITVMQTGPAPRSRDGTEVNESSTILHVEAAGVSLMLLGDLEVAGQQRLARGPLPAGVDIVKIAHHGSAAQDAGLVRALAAPVAIATVGADNDYGHPAPEALDLYGAGGAVVLRTDLCGDVLLGAADGAVTLVRPCRSAMAG